MCVFSAIVRNDSRFLINVQHYSKCSPFTTELHKNWSCFLFSFGFHAWEIGTNENLCIFSKCFDEHALNFVEMRGILARISKTVAVNRFILVMSWRYFNKCNLFQLLWSHYCLPADHAIMWSSKTRLSKHLMHGTLFTSRNYFAKPTKITRKIVTVFFKHNVNI